MRRDQLTLSGVRAPMCCSESSIQENIRHISISSGAGGHPCTSSRRAQRSSVGFGAMNQVGGAGGASRTFDSSSKNKHKFSTLEKSGAVKMATVAMKGIDPRRVSKLLGLAG